MNMNKMRTVLSFEIGSPEDADNSDGFLRRHRLTCRVNLLYLLLSLVGFVGAIILFSLLLRSDSSSQPIEDQQKLPSVLPSLPSPPNSRPQYQNLSNTEIAYRLSFLRNLTRNSWLTFLPSASSRLSSGIDEKYLTDSNVLKGLTTLLVMNLTAEFKESQKLLFEGNASLKSLGDHMYKRGATYLVHNYIGPLLSLYALTNDTRFLHESIEASNKLKKTPAKNSSGVLLWDSSVEEQLISVDMASRYLEYSYLADLTHNDELHQEMRHIHENITRSHLKFGMMHPIIFIFNVSSMLNKSENALPSVERMAPIFNTFYSTLIKRFIQSGGRDTDALAVYQEKMDLVKSRKLIIQTSNGLTQVKFQAIFTDRDDTSNLTQPLTMSEQTCALGGMFAQSGRATRTFMNDRIPHLPTAQVDIEQGRFTAQLAWARGITDTCHTIVNRTRAGLFPYVAQVHDDGSVQKLNTARNSVAGTRPKWVPVEIEEEPEEINIRSELAESYFYLWRSSHESKYREYAWELALNIEKSRPLKGATYFPPDFFSSTLKYLYLTYTDPSYFSLDDWIFNHAGQPLPICGRSNMYPTALCQ